MSNQCCGKDQAQRRRWRFWGRGSSPLQTPLQVLAALPRCHATRLVPVQVCCSALARGSRTAGCGGALNAGGLEVLGSGLLPVSPLPSNHGFRPRPLPLPPSHPALHLFLAGTLPLPQGPPLSFSLFPSPQPLRSDRVWVGFSLGWTLRLGILRAVVRPWGVPFFHHVQQVYNGAAVQV